MGVNLHIIHTDENTMNVANPPDLPPPGIREKYFLVFWPVVTGATQKVIGIRE
jgi:hypothetical protein